MLLLALLLETAPPMSIKSPPCAGNDTLSMARCMDGKIEQAEDRLKHYRAVAFNRFHDEGESHDPATAKAVENSFIIADAFRTTYCDAVYQMWIGGSIRYSMHQGCTLRMINRQTHDIWRDFLGYVDTTPPMLPEPKPMN